MLKKKLRQLAPCLILTGLCPAPVPAEPLSGDPLTLRRSFETALANSQDIKIMEQDIVQSRYRARSAVSSAFPRLDWNWMGTRQDLSGSLYSDSAGNDFIQENMIESKFSLRQPIFSGLREFSAYLGFKKEAERDALELKDAVMNLYQFTAQAFYAVVEQETNLQNVNTALRLATERVQELQSFSRLGKARQSELFTAQAQAAAFKAQARQIQGRIHAARLELSYLLNQDVTRVPIKDEIPDTLAPGPVSHFLDKAAERSDVQAQKRDMEAKSLRVRYERGSYWPSVDVSGNYYTRRPDFYEGIDWDVMLAARFPLFQGGSVYARVKEAKSDYRQSEFTLEQLLRQLKRDVQEAHANLVAALGESEALEEAFEAAKKSYQAQRKEYGLGLVTNLDVLAALNSMLNQKEAWDNSRVRVKLLYIRLQALIENLP